MNPNAWPGLPKGRSVGTCDVQLKEPVLISTTSTSWTWSLIQKWPMLSSSPVGMRDGSKVMGGPAESPAHSASREHDRRGRLVLGIQAGQGPVIG